MSIAKKDAAKKLSLTEERMKQFEVFRHNLRLLRHTTGLSAEKLGKELGFDKYHRVVDLEYGRATEPKLQEVIVISKYFNVSIDNLLYNRIKIAFEPNNQSTL